MQRYHQASTSLRLVDDHSGPVRVSTPGAEVLEADFASPESLRHLSDCDVVLHLAARSGVVVCQRDPEGSRKVNLDGTRRLANFCRERNIPVAFASSFSVVGIPAKLPITEKTPANPTHEYSQQKAGGEEIIRSLKSGDGAPGAVLRMSNLYGSYRSQGNLVAKGNVLNLYAAQAARRNATSLLQGRMELAVGDSARNSTLETLASRTFSRAKASARRLTSIMTTEPCGTWRAAAIPMGPQPQPRSSTRSLPERTMFSTRSAVPGSSPSEAKTPAPVRNRWMRPRNSNRISRRVGREVGSSVK